jgi:glycerate dehydrogenase
LDSGVLGGYGADVVSVEPMLPGNPLLGAPNCVITPHIAWAAKETRIRLIDAAAENLDAFLKGRAVNVVS